MGRQDVLPAETQWSKKAQRSCSLASDLELEGESNTIFFFTYHTGKATCLGLRSNVVLATTGLQWEAAKSGASGLGRKGKHRAPGTEVNSVQNTAQDLGEERAKPAPGERLGRGAPCAGVGRGGSCLIYPSPFGGRAPGNLPGLGGGGECTLAFKSCFA